MTAHPSKPSKKRSRPNIRDERDIEFMRDAVSEAKKGLGKTAPNPAVGCVLVKSGRVIGRGFHRRAGAAHAEVEALASVRGTARGATAYVTLEPCCHQGKTPPCTEALIEAGVARVVAGCRDPNPRVSGKGLRKLRSRGIECSVGKVLQDECRDLIRGFEHWIRTNRPWVELKLASSLDGRIATGNGRSKWISSAASRDSVQDMRARADVILVGVGTVLADDPRLTSRRRGAKNPRRVILDRSLKTPPTAKVVTQKGSALIVCSKQAPLRVRQKLKRAGAEILELSVVGARGWERLLDEFGRRGFHEVLVEGGSKIASLALKARVVNELTIFYNARLLGADGIPLIGPLGLTDPAAAPRFETKSWRQLGPDLVWVGRPVK